MNAKQTSSAQRDPVAMRTIAPPRPGDAVGHACRAAYRVREAMPGDLCALLDRLDRID